MKSPWTKRTVSPCTPALVELTGASNVTESAWLHTAKGKSSSEQWRSLMAEAVLPLSRLQFKVLLMRKTCKSCGKKCFHSELWVWWYKAVTQSISRSSPQHLQLQRALNYILKVHKKVRHVFNLSKPAESNFTNTLNDVQHSSLTIIVRL